MVIKKGTYLMSFPGSSIVKNLPAKAGDMDSIPGSGRSPGEGNGNPLQYSCLENSVDRGAEQATVHGVAERHDCVHTCAYTHARACEDWIGTECTH